MAGFGRTFWVVMLIASWARARQPTALVVKRPHDPSDCPDAPTLAAAVERHVGHHALDPQAVDTSERIEVQIERTPTGFVARVSTQGGRSGVRELRDDNPQTCSGLADALSLTIALILDAIESRTDAQSVQGRSSPPAAPQVQPPDRRVWSAMIEAGGAIGYGLPYSFGPAGHGALDLVSPAGYSGGVGVIWSGANSIEYPPGRVRVSLWMLPLRGCAPILGRLGSARVSACLLASAGVLYGTGVGYTRDASVRRPWYGLGGELATQGPLAGPFDWSLRAMLMAPLNPEGFSINGIGVAYESRPIAFVLGGAIRTSIW